MASRRERVQVIRRGRGLELRVDGTFASWYEPGRVTTGSVWDALGLPVLFLPPARRRRVLILGLGGGSAARLICALAPRARIVGVEYDAQVLRVARRSFGLDAMGIETVVGDARSFLEHTRKRFDLVVDDVFVGRGRAVHKPDWLPEPGLDLARRRLADGGLLVSNAIDEARPVAASLGRLFPARVAIRVEDYDNCILVGGPADLTARRLRSAASGEPLLAESLGGLSFRTLGSSR